MAEQSPLEQLHEMILHDARHHHHEPLTVCKCKQIGIMKQQIEKALSDNVFIMCENESCFQLHEMSQIAERVLICHRVRKTGVRGNWD